MGLLFTMSIHYACTMNERMKLTTCAKSAFHLLYRTFRVSQVGVVVLVVQLVVNKVAIKDCTPRYYDTKICDKM